MHYVLMYDYAPDYLARRAEFRDEHLQLAWESHGRGEFQLGGVLAEPVDSALLWFKAESAAVVEQFVARDPYVKHGLVLNWRIRPWMTVAGTLADAPIYPVQ
ncbi:hypothetical protein GTP41_25335 [Pseudoduganella sp. DS3]|uniref:YCII-related domain-containing protein n=1 Tax=Pseudoduganella guangdongensis TaxID=2692179 RepID=A0A6N9HPM1_9BURK|nr:YciI-like protein [Pseudoduganella guangdongensis]MYN05424.1 hypothetical protein [Pseudoduganella guangdongensis]